MDGCRKNENKGIVFNLSNTKKTGVFGSNDALYIVSSIKSESRSEVEMKIIASIFLIAISGLSFADTMKSEKDTRKFSDQLTNNIYKEKFQTTFDAAKPHWPIPPVEIDSVVNKINQQWPLVRQRFGNPVGIEFIKKKRIGKSFLRYYYLHKFENHAIYWRIDYYKAKNEWKINTVVFLDSLGELFE